MKGKRPTQNSIPPFAAKKPVWVNSQPSLYQRAIDLHCQGNLKAAKKAFQEHLAKQPQHLEALHGFAVVCYQLGDFANARRATEQGLRARPDSIEWLTNLLAIQVAQNDKSGALLSYEKAISIEFRPELCMGYASLLFECGRHDEAIDVLRKVIVRLPGHEGVLLQLSHYLSVTSKPEEALLCFTEIIQGNPHQVEALNGLGSLYMQQGQLEEAMQAYRTAVEVEPDNQVVLLNLAAAIEASGDLEGALAAVDHALKVDGGLEANAFARKGAILQNQARYLEAIEYFDRALMKLVSDRAATYSNRAYCYSQLKNLDQAVVDCESALKLDPNFIQAHNNLGNVYQEKGDFSRAISSYERALALSPDYFEALNNVGNAYRATKQFELATSALKRAIKIKPTSFEAMTNLAYCLFEQNELTGALREVNKAIKLNPEFTDALNIKGNVHFAQKEYLKALKIYKKIISINPSYPEAAGMRLHAAMQSCEWGNLDEYLEEIYEGLDDGQLVSAPFPLLATSAPPSRQKQCAELYCLKRFGGLTARKGKQNPKWSKTGFAVHASRRIRIGYFSADFYQHATSYLIAEMLELHDRKRFEVFAYSYADTPKDEMRDRIIEGVDQFVDVAHFSDEEIVERARQDQLDIAIDLKGHTQDSRLGVFARRVAPLQFHYLGYPGTLGCDFMDGLIADPVVVPVGSESDFTESIVRMPVTYQVNDRGKKPSNSSLTRKEAGLPQDAFVYCCFNNAFKITPDVFSVWMDVLRESSNSVLWLLEVNADAKKNLKKEAQTRGVDQGRLIFAPWVSQENHLARLGMADVVLDTWHYNAHTTASDALWMGVPMVTLPGNTFSSRVGASLLSALGMHELIASTTHEYIGLSKRMQADDVWSLSIREKLRVALERGELFNTVKFVGNYEKQLLTFIGSK